MLFSESKISPALRIPLPPMLNYKPDSLSKNCSFRAGQLYITKIIFAYWCYIGDDGITEAGPPNRFPLFDPSLGPSNEIIASVIFFLKGGFLLLLL